MPLPNSLPWMESVDAKMIRAHENIFELAREINEWFASITINIYLKNAPHLPNPWMVAVASDYVPPVRLSVLLGECIHNMRSAVDNLVCGLVRTTKPRSKCSGLAFPMLKDANEWDRKTDQKVKGVPDAAIATIKQLQPQPGSVHSSPLTILNKLSNLDKHCGCNFSLAYARDTVFRLHVGQGRILEIRPGKQLYLGDAHDFVLPIDKRLVAAGTRVQSSGTLVLTLQEEGPWGDAPVMEVLQYCFDYVERSVIGPLTHFFKGNN
jgi:hypothetical protein